MIHLDDRDTRPIYSQIIDGFREQILSGILQQGDKLPSVRELAGNLTINPNTIQKSYAELIRRGVIIPSPGSGTYVAPEARLRIREAATEKLTKLEELVAVAERNAQAEKKTAKRNRVIRFTAAGVMLAVLAGVLVYFNFIHKTPETHSGNAVGDTLEIHKTFSYSEEYDETLLLSEDEKMAMMMSLTEEGQGTLIQETDDMDSVLKGYITELERIFDPRFSFMIAAIVLFLLDIAVCKFKFKWIHEIIRDRKRKNNL